MSELSCPECGQRFRPKAGHCRGGAYGGCCRSFLAAPTDNDPHRTGNHYDGSRRCKTDAELLDAGWQFEDGFWADPKTIRNRGRLAKILTDGGASNPGSTEPAKLDTSRGPSSSEALGGTS